MRVVGIDLAASERRPSGFCFLYENLNCKTKLVYSNQEIVEETLKCNPDLVSIDAPLSLPKGRKNINQRDNNHFRICDRELLKMKIKFFPITLGPMRTLTERGIRLRNIFERKKLKVIESFPGAAQDILGMPRKQRGIEKLKESLIKYGVKGDIEKTDITHDELDAITCAIVGNMYLTGKYIAIGDPKEGLIILPKKDSKI